MTFFLFILSIAVAAAQAQPAMLTDSKDGKKSVPRTERDGQDGWKLGKLDGVSLADVVTTFVDDRDGKKYKAVRIGTQVWMAENLNYDASGSVCYKNDSANCEKYGRLYNWKTAMKACPVGFHIPTRLELNELMDYVCGEKGACKKLSNKSGWNKDGNGTDDYGFSALPGGAVFHDDSFGVGDIGYWWSSSKDYSGLAHHFQGMGYGDKLDYDNHNENEWFFSVRCVQD